MTSPALLTIRVLAQPWARIAPSQGFAHELELEPLGFLSPNGHVYPSPVPGGKEGRFHRGIDFPLPALTPITSALGGRVVHAGWDQTGFGLMVAIEGARYISRYAHLSSIRAELGAWLTAGSLLGRSGSTGNSTGPHLHYEVFDKWLGAYVDPLA